MKTLSGTQWEEAERRFNDFRQWICDRWMAELDDDFECGDNDIVNPDRIERAKHLSALAILRGWEVDPDDRVPVEIAAVEYANYLSAMALVHGWVICPENLVPTMQGFLEESGNDYSHLDMAGVWLISAIFESGHPCIKRVGSLSKLN